MVRSPLHYGWTVSACCLSALTIFLVIGVGFTSTPAVAADLGLTHAESQWVLDSYNVVFAALLLPAGAIADRFGRRRTLIVGMLVFSAGISVSVFADSFATLVASRALAGVGSAVAFPGTLATISMVVPADKRAIPVGSWAGCLPGGGAVGTLLAGGVMETGSWRPSFLVISVAGVGCALFVALVAPETRDPEHASFDPGGGVLAVLGVGGIVLGVTEGPVHGWIDPLTLAGLAGGTGALVAFVWWELRAARPLLDVRAFLVPVFGASAVAIFLTMLATFGWFFLVLLFETYTLGYGPLRAAFGMAPIMLTMVGLAAVGGLLVERFGTKRMVAWSLVAGSLGAALMAAGATVDEYWPVAIGIAIFGGGVGLGAVPTTEAITNALPPAKQGVASAVNDLTRELGAAFGIAILGSAFNAGYRHGVAADLDPGSDEIAALVQDSPAAGTAAAERLGADGERYLEVVQDSTALGWGAGMAVTSALLAAGLVFFLWRWPSGSEPVAAKRATDLEPAGLHGAVRASDGSVPRAAVVIMLDRGGREIARAEPDPAAGTFRIPTHTVGAVLVGIATSHAPQAQIVQPANGLPYDFVLPPESAPRRSPANQAARVDVIVP